MTQKEPWLDVLLGIIFLAIGIVAFQAASLWLEGTPPVAELTTLRHLFTAAAVVVAHGD
jgi:hypothetical protein